MKKNIIILLLITICSNLCAQKNFEGKILFKTDISIPDSAKDVKMKLQQKYGDSLEIYYSKNGNFKRQYLNSGNSGNDYQLYFPENGKIKFVKKNTTKIDSGFVNTNSLIFVEKIKVANEKIMKVDCECYLYKAADKFGKKANVKYCFSNQTPKLDFKLYEKHEDFFLNDFFKTSQRPYLKFSFETDRFILTYTATELEEMTLNQVMFEK